MDNLIDSDENKEIILEEFLEVATSDGCTNQALKKAFTNCEIDPNLINVFFENGLVDLINFYISNYNQKALEKINEDYPNFSRLKVRQKIKLLTLARFEVEIDNKTPIRRIINFCLNPKNIINSEYHAKPLELGLIINYKIADFIWHAINDKSTNFSFYTKRLILSKIVFRTIFAFLVDESDDLKDTSDFLDQEIERVMKFEKHKQNIKNFSSQIKEKLYQFSHKENNQLKSLKEIFKDLPFIRLFK